MKWQVHIPAGFWMAGVHTFNSKRGATDFADYWQDVERKAGKANPVPYPLISAHRKAPEA
jgi:hypothetical protein